MMMCSFVLHGSKTACVSNFRLVVPAFDGPHQPKGTPKMEFVQTGMKWVVEFQGSAEGVVTVEVTDKKHQVSETACISS